jgi:hypothetical protein
MKLKERFGFRVIAIFMAFHIGVNRPQGFLSSFLKPGAQEALRANTRLRNRSPDITAEMRWWLLPPTVDLVFGLLLNLKRSVFFAAMVSGAPVASFPRCGSLQIERTEPCTRDFSQAMALATVASNVAFDNFLCCRLHHLWSKRTREQVRVNWLQGPLKVETPVKDFAKVQDARSMRQTAGFFAHLCGQVNE